jgi:hypothetical protein
MMILSRYVTRYSKKIPASFFQNRKEIHERKGIWVLPSKLRLGGLITKHATSGFGPWMEGTEHSLSRHLALDETVGPRLRRIDLCVLARVLEALMPTQVCPC